MQFIQNSQVACGTEKDSYYQMTVNALCAPDAKERGAFKVDDSNACDVQISFSSAQGCPKFKATPIVDFLAANPWIMGTLLIVFGIVSAFFGGKLFPKVLATAFGGAVFFVVILVLSAIGAMKALDGNKKGA